MPCETEIILSFVFKRSGKPKLNFSELYLALSVDLNWFTPEDAKAFVNKATNNKLLKKEGDMIQPTFEYNKIIVPIGFTPSKQVFQEKVIEKSKEKEEILLDKIIVQFIEKTELDSHQIKDRIMGISKTKNVIAEVGAALLAKEYDITLEDFFEDIENIIFTEKRE